MPPYLGPEFINLTEHEPHKVKNEETAISTLSNNHKQNLICTTNEVEGVKNETTKTILQILSEGQTTISFLAHSLQIDTSKLLEQLLHLELERKITIQGEYVKMITW